MRYLLLTFILSLLIGSIQANTLIQRCPRPWFCPTVYLGPEAYYLERRLETGTHQEGTLYGLRGLQERVRPKSFYWALEGHWARGHLSGRSSRKFPVCSEMTDADIEGRIGYTFCSEHFPRLLFTPVLGLGYFHEINDFRRPTRLTIVFRTHFTYLPVGFSARFYLSSHLSVGVDYRARLTIDGQTRALDPDLGGSTLNFDYLTHRTLDVPIRYRLSGRARNLELLLAPFWRKRQYGRHFSVEHDFYYTRIHVIGARLMLGYYF